MIVSAHNIRSPMNRRVKIKIKWTMLIVLKDLSMLGIFRSSTLKAIILL